MQQNEQTREHVPGELVVRYAAGADAGTVREQYDLADPERIGLPRTEVVQVEPGTVAQTAAELTADPAVVFAEPNYVVRAAGIPNDPYFPQLWGLHQSSDADVDAPQAWDLTTGTSDLTVAVVDTGVALDHPELAPSIWRNPGESGGGKEANGVDDDGNGFVDDFQGWDWIGDDRYPRDLHGHGTHVAGTIGARGNDGAGVAGLSWGTKIMALRGLKSQGEGTTGDIAAAFAYAARKGAKVVNVSLGGHGHSLAVLGAITAAPDTLFVVAAGNAGANNDVSSSYPCNYPAPNIVCVAASDSNDGLASFSNYGATTVDLAAPGVGILSVQPAFVTRFSEEFAGDLAQAWTTGGVNGTWTRSAEGFAVDSADASYQDNADHWMATTAPFDLSGMNDCLLRYSLKLDLDQNDRFVTEASTNASDWTTLGAWTGSSQGQWTRITDPLFAFDGRPSVHLRFRLVTDSSVTRDGAALDSIGVRCNSSTYSG
ncbi:MAG: S8 family serine peptidase, partial [Actinomycetota bacterium]|nr:S8 family serine peptidase [Actinomycetota bacterium]